MQICLLFNLLLNFIYGDRRGNKKFTYSECGRCDKQGAPGAQVETGREIKD
jgi:hypothetical protein